MLSIRALQTNRSTGSGRGRRGWHPEDQSQRGARFAGRGQGAAPSATNTNSGVWSWGGEGAGIRERLSNRAAGCVTLTGEKTNQSAGSAKAQRRRYGMTTAIVLIRRRNKRQKNPQSNCSAQISRRRLRVSPVRGLCFDGSGRIRKEPEVTRSGAGSPPPPPWRPGCASAPRARPGSASSGAASAPRAQPRGKGVVEVRRGSRRARGWGSRRPRKPGRGDRGGPKMAERRVGRHGCLRAQAPG